VLPLALALSRARWSVDHWCQRGGVRTFIDH
jgi:hypothetical protein